MIGVIKYSFIHILIIIYIQILNTKISIKWWFSNVQMKKKVGVDKLAKFQTTAACSVQTRPVLDNLEALQCKQCQRWQYHMQDW